MTAMTIPRLPSVQFDPKAKCRELAEHAMAALALRDCPSEESFANSAEENKWWDRAFDRLKDSRVFVPLPDGSEFMLYFHTDQYSELLIDPDPCECQRMVEDNPFTINKTRAIYRALHAMEIDMDSDEPVTLETLERQGVAK